MTRGPRQATPEDSWASGIDGLLIEENLFDHNGWSEFIPGANATTFNHNIYVVTSTIDLVARGNILARASATGLQARSGGIVENNLFVDNPFALNWGWALGGLPTSPDGYGGNVKDNVVLDCVNRGFGSGAIAVGNIGASFTAAIESNLISRCLSGYAYGIHIAGTNGYGIYGIELTGNVVTEVFQPLNVLGQPGIGPRRRLGHWQSLAEPRRISKTAGQFSQCNGRG